MSEQEQTTTTTEQKTDTEDTRPLEDADLEKVVGGASPDQFDRWHTLPDGSGSGAGE